MLNFIHDGGYNYTYASTAACSISTETHIARTCKAPNGIGTICIIVTVVEANSALINICMG